MDAKAFQSILALGRSEFPHAYSISQGSFGQKISLHRAWTNEVERAILSGPIVEVELNYAKGWSDDSISFLPRIKHIKALTLIHPMLERDDPLLELQSLEWLNLGTSCTNMLSMK